MFLYNLAKFKFETKIPYENLKERNEGTRHLNLSPAYFEEDFALVTGGPPLFEK